MMKEIIFSLFFVSAVWYDWKKQQIPIYLFAAAGICGLLLLITDPELYRGEDRYQAVCFLMALFPGIACLLLTFFSRGAIGAGDGCFFLVAASYLSWDKVWFLWLGGLFCCSLGSLCVIGWGVLHGVSVRKKRLPFLPFLLPIWIWIQKM